MQKNFNSKAHLIELPLVTVVTVVFNGGEYLDSTIKSIVGQTYPNVEYIIIDGGSTDNTLDIIYRHFESIDYFISEADEGIYDAMNKAIEVASGTWINFMNAGDVFFSSDTLDLVFGPGTRHSNYDIVYGNVHIRYADFFRIERAGKLNHLWSGMKFCHQSTFVKTNIQKLNKFNKSNKIAADLEFFYMSYKRGMHFKYIDLIISSVSTGGLSESNRLKTILASRDAVGKSNDSLLVNFAYYFFYVSSYFRSILKMMLPKELTKTIIKMKN